MNSRTILSVGLLMIGICMPDAGYTFPASVPTPATTGYTIHAAPPAASIITLAANTSLSAPLPGPSVRPTNLSSFLSGASSPVASGSAAMDHLPLRINTTFLTLGSVLFPREPGSSMISADDSVSARTLRMEVDRLLEEAEQTAESGDQGRTEELLMESEKLAERIGYDSGAALSRMLRGQLYLERGRYQEAREQLELAWMSLQGHERELMTGNLLATAYRFTGNFTESLSLYLQMLEIARGEGNLRFESGIQQNLAVVYVYLGETSQAAEHYFRSLELAEELEDDALKVVILNNIGELYREEGNYHRARQYLSESLDLSRRIGSRSDEGRSLLNLGIVRYQTGAHDQALELFQQALELSEELGNEHSPLQIYYNMGNVYLEQERFDLAEDAYRASLEMSDELRSGHGQFYNNLGIGNVRLAHNEYEEAIGHYLKALELAGQFESGEMQKLVLDKLIRAYEERGDYSSAYRYLKEYQAVTDSLATLNQNQALARYQTLFDLRSERQERELLEEKLQTQRGAFIITMISLGLVAAAAAALLLLYRRQKSTLRELSLQKEKLEELYTRVDAQKEELVELNKTKDKLFSILAHDLRSPISQLQSLVYLIRRGAMKEVEMDEVLQQVDQQVRDSIATLENYLNWARSQMDGLEPDIVPVSLHEMIEEVLTMLRSNARKKRVRICNKTDAGALALADENMLRIILQNLISNAIKYSLPGGCVQIRAEETTDGLRLSVEDQGIGIPEEMHKRLFRAFETTQEGTFNERGTGLGLSICQEFALRQNSRLWFESREGEGTVFHLEMPAVEMAVW